MALAVLLNPLLESYGGFDMESYVHEDRMCCGAVEEAAEGKSHAHLGTG